MLDSYVWQNVLKKTLLRFEKLISERYGFATC